MKFIEDLKFDKNGLIPCIVQDFHDGTVLMMAYMNKEAAEKTFKTKKATFWSRSRNKFWIKGEQSGNFQNVKEMYYDCDSDCLLIKVEQIGGAACHTGYRSCFFNRINQNGEPEQIGEKIFNPDDVYK